LILRDVKGETRKLARLVKDSAVRFDIRPFSIFTSADQESSPSAEFKALYFLQLRAKSPTGIQAVLWKHTAAKTSKTGFICKCSGILLLFGVSSFDEGDKRQATNEGGAWCFFVLRFFVLLLLLPPLKRGGIEAEKREAQWP